MKQLLMGNEAIGLAAIQAGVNLVSGYPGTPSTEVLETVAKQNDGSIYVEWSTNEKSALEVAAGAAIAGARVMVTMKQVGLNVASDPLMSLAYLGIKGAMVVVVADDPGPISSQTEQDTRHFAEYAKLPVFDPSSPEEAYRMIRDAFDLSQKYHTPVLFRPTTRVCHACASVEVKEEKIEHKPQGFVKDAKWVIFPRLTYQNHIQIEKNLRLIAEDFNQYDGNQITETAPNTKKGVACGGISYAYVKEALNRAQTHVRLLKIGTPHPFPEELALQFMEGLYEILVVEELDPVIEKALLLVAGKHHIKINILGKLDGSMKNAGENSLESVLTAIEDFLELPKTKYEPIELPPLPVRPPVLCVGCPHRASFYAVKKAMKGQKAVFCGDIGCYTLGNAQPLDMVDTCLCMGAGITIAQGLQHIEPDAVHFAFIGDSTFFHTGIPGVINAVYNQTDLVLVILDNSTTAMTGHQPHPGTGKTMMNTVSPKIDLEKLLLALGVQSVKKVNPFDLTNAITCVKEAAQTKGVAAIIFEAPCISLFKPEKKYQISDSCTSCQRCIKELGCPAISKDSISNKVVIDQSLCYGCSLCAQICPAKAIVIGGDKSC